MTQPDASDADLASPATVATRSPGLPAAVQAIVDANASGTARVAGETLDPALTQGIDPIARYDRVSIALHWTSALLVAVILATAWTRVLAQSAATALLLLALHRSAGLALWALMSGRLAWKLARARQPALPPSLPALQRLAARATEAALYVLLLVQPACGLAMSLYIGKPFKVFGLRLPALLDYDADRVAQLGALHTACGFGLAALAGAHVAAAMYHHFVRRDDVLRSMLPGPGSN